jgi:hypothetical protein
MIDNLEYKGDYESNAIYQKNEEEYYVEKIFPPMMYEFLRARQKNDHHVFHEKTRGKYF